MRRLLIVMCLVAGCGGGGGSGDDGGDDDAAAPDAEVGVVEPVHLIGRFDANQRFSWPGSTIASRFDGTTISVELEEENGPNWYDVTVDGVTTVLTTTGGDQTYLLAADLGAGEHDVVIARRTESFYGVTRFVGFSGGTVIDTPRPTRLIEVIGDSITCGYGVLGLGPSCSFTPDTEAETRAWGALAAAELGVAHAAIAYSGLGVYRNYGGEPGATIPDLYGRILAEDPASEAAASETPDLVVINLGTNDFSTGDPGQPYVTAYASFIEQIRAAYGADIEIVVASSPMLGEPDHTTQAGYLQQLVEPHVSYLDLPTQLDADGYGCDYHPSEITQQKMAAALVVKVRALLGW
jgi:lysophospholipase L1-like esterase